MILLALFYHMAFVTCKPLGAVAFEEVPTDWGVGAEFLVKVSEEGGYVAFTSPSSNSRTAVKEQMYITVWAHCQTKTHYMTKIWVV